jgi:hypothetical protein
MSVAKNKQQSGSYDARGVRDSLLACLHCVRQHYPTWTLTQCLVALEAVVAHERGEPHTVISLANALNAPYTTVSRVISSLALGEDAVLMHKRHPTDQRKKLVVPNPTKLSLASGVVLKETLERYYGDSLFALEHRGRAPQR